LRVPQEIHVPQGATSFSTPTSMRSFTLSKKPKFRVVCYRLLAQVMFSITRIQTLLYLTRKLNTHSLQRPNLVNTTAHVTAQFQRNLIKIKAPQNLVSPDIMHLMCKNGKFLLNMNFASYLNTAATRLLEYKLVLHLPRMVQIAHMH
jgi:hypothetical protein